VGLGLCAAVFAGSALADPGNGNGNGNGNGGTPPGQEKKAEQPVPAPTPAAAPAPVPAQHVAAPGQAKKAEKSAATTAKKSEHKSEHKSAAKSEHKTAAKSEHKIAAKSEHKTKQSVKAEQKSERKSAVKSEQKSEPKASTSKGRSAEAHHHVIICHRTGSNSNPYVVINIPWTAWSEAHSPDTGAHPDLNGRHDIMLKDPASRPGSKDGFTKSSCGSSAAPAVVPQQSQPIDVCPNVEGMQTTVPAGMVKDASGNCVLQAQQVDVCPNIEGMQTTVPAGMVKDASGNCVLQAQQVDVCPNIEGMQTTVPAGLIKDTSGNCLLLATATVVGTKVEKKELKEVLAATSPATVAKAKAAATPATKVAANEKPASGVLGAVASAPESIAATAAGGELPFTGIPLWIAALLGAGLLATGMALRRAAQH
jgi:hypothetical protein